MPHRERKFIIRTISYFLGKMRPPTTNEALSHNIKTTIQLFTYLNTPYVYDVLKDIDCSKFRRTVYAKITQLEHDIEEKRASTFLSNSTLKNIAKLMKIFNKSRTLYAPAPPPVALPAPVEPTTETTCS